jgi:hypothetical protein
VKKRKKLLNAPEFAVVVMSVLPVMTITKTNHPAVHQTHALEKDRIQEKENVVLILGVRSVVPAGVMKMKIGVLLLDQLMIGKVQILKMKPENHHGAIIAVIALIIVPHALKAVRMILLLLDRENVVPPEIQFLPEDKMMMRRYPLSMYPTIPLISQIMSRIIPILIPIFKIFGVDDGKH